MATKVFFVNREYQADTTVFIVDREYKAQMNIFPVDREYQAQMKVFVVDREYKAKLKVFVVDREYKWFLVDQGSSSLGFTLYWVGHENYSMPNNLNRAKGVITPLLSAYPWTK